MSAWPHATPKRSSDRGKAPPDVLGRWAAKRAATFTVGHRLLRSRGLKLAPGQTFSGSRVRGMVIDVVDWQTGEDRGKRMLRLYEGKWEVTKV